MSVKRFSLYRYIVMESLYRGHYWEPTLSLRPSKVVSHPRAYALELAYATLYLQLHAFIESRNDINSPATFSISRCFLESTVLVFANNIVVLVLRICCQAGMLKPWYGYPVPENATISDV